MKENKKHISRDISKYFILGSKAKQNKTKQNKTKQNKTKGGGGVGGNVQNK